MNTRTGGLILLIVGGLITLGGFSDFNAVQMIVGGLMTYFGSQVYNRNPTVTAAKQPKSVGSANTNFELSDDMIIRLAKRLNGKLSVDDLTTQTSLSRDQAQQRLESMHQKGICTINLDQVAEDGKIYYYF
jgi:hypothetical protein